MPLTVAMEPPEYDMPLERCVFCNGVTRMWHLKSNTPVCKLCASMNDEKSLMSAIEAHTER